MRPSCTCTRRFHLLDLNSGNYMNSIDYFFDSETDHNNIAWGIQIYNEMWGN